MVSGSKSKFVKNPIPASGPNPGRPAEQIDTYEERNDKDPDPLHPHSASGPGNEIWQILDPERKDQFSKVGILHTNGDKNGELGTRDK